MEVVLAEFTRKGCVVYFDDMLMLVMGKTLEEHNTNLAGVFVRLRESGLKVKPKKCSFAQAQVTYFGHIVSAKGVQTDPQKLEVVRTFPQPTDVKSLRSALEMVSYYRRFIPQFAKVAGPHHSLTHKDVNFVWIPCCQVAFEELTGLLTPLAHCCM